VLDALGDLFARDAGERHLRVVGCGHSTKEHDVRPAVVVAERVLKRFRAQVAFLVRKSQRVGQRRRSFGEQVLAAEQNPQARDAIEPVGLLLPRPPHFVLLFGCKVGALMLLAPVVTGEGPRDLRQVRAQVVGLLRKPALEPATWLHRARRESAHGSVKGYWSQGALRPSARGENRTCCGACAEQQEGAAVEWRAARLFCIRHCFVLP
jgi:hypothetical protein